jgi:serine phosphatase RsbU (regulator of sigma subunit)
MSRLIPGEIATMCLVSIDVATGRMLLANAGHPSPLIRTGSEVVAISERSPLLGIPARPARDVEITLAPDDLLVLYTDGLIETHAETFDESLARLVGSIEVAEPDLEELATRILSEVGPSTPRDDIAMVVLRRTA